MPYRGTSQSVADIMGGTIDAAFGDISNVVPFVDGGKLAALATTGTERSPLMPNVPTTTKSGISGVRTVNWYGLHVNSKTPPDIVEKLKSAVLATQNDPEFKAVLAKNATSTGTVGAQEFDKMIQEERQRLTPVIRSLGEIKIASREFARMDVRRLIDVKNGTASREIFVDRDVYRQEQEQIFARAWLFVGHECQVPNPDDFYVSRMGEESVILTRDRQGKIHVFLNTCRHRGMKLCRYDEGNTRVFSCPYHAWSYSTDGNLVSTPGELFGVPGYKKYYHEELDKKEWGLIPVAQMVNYRGTIWATWDKNAAPFEDSLGGMRLWLDSALDHRDGREGGSVVLVGVQKWRTNCNWKFPATNFIGDAAHGVSHQSVDLVNLNPERRRGPARRAPGRTCRVRLARSRPRRPRLRCRGPKRSSRARPSFQSYPHVSEYLLNPPRPI